MISATDSIKIPLIAIAACVALVALSDLILSVYVVLTPAEQHTWEWHRRNVFLPGELDTWMVHRRIETYLRRCEAGSQIVAAAMTGLNKNQILQFLGKPKTTDGPIQIDSWNRASEAPLNLLYPLGEGLLVVSLNECGQCIAANSYDWNQECNYESWKAREILKFALGRTSDEVKARFGSPTRLGNVPVIDLNPYEDTAEQSATLRFLAQAIQGTTANAAQIPSEHQFYWDYDTGYSTSMQLIFKNGKCISGSEQSIFH